MTESTEVTIEDISEANAPAIYVKGGLLQFLEAVKVEVTAEVPDLTTRKGRERIASLAAKVSKSKVAVEKPGREYLARLKEMPKTVEAELREFVRAMDALRDETRAPLTQWEEAESARVAKHEAAIAALSDLSEADPSRFDSEYIRQCLIKATEVSIGDHWEEFEAQAARAKDKAVTAFADALVKREQYETQQAELERLRAEAAHREQMEREERIAREAAEAERVAAEQRAQAERDAAARREAELIEQAAQAQRQADQEKRDAAAAAEQAKLNAELAEQRRIAAEKQAEIDRIAAEQRAAQEKADADRRQAEAVERAAAAERQRQADEQARIEAEAKAREADRAHKGATLKAAKEAIMGAGISEEQAKAVVKLIASGAVPAVSIQY